MGTEALWCGAAAGARRAAANGAWSACHVSQEELAKQQMGDWHCGQCGNLNWARRNECNRCKSRRPMSSLLLDPKAPGYLPTTARAVPSGIDVSVGDWECKGCGNFNWARRNECNRCGQAHPTRTKPPPSKGAIERDRASGLDTGSSYSTVGVSGVKRTGEGGGFKEFDEEEDDRRKRRAMEERLEKEMRKAQKTKCPYCKRASCIC